MYVNTKGLQFQTPAISVHLYADKTKIVNLAVRSIPNRKQIMCPNSLNLNYLNSAA